jgi:hypothetical protein
MMDAAAPTVLMGRFIDPANALVFPEGQRFKSGCFIFCRISCRFDRPVDARKVQRNETTRTKQAPIGESTQGSIVSGSHAARLFAAGDARSEGVAREAV